MISAGQLLGFALASLVLALYLIWLGIHAIRHRKSLAEAFAVAMIGVGVTVALTGRNR
jgi:hypothetical protein